MAGKGGNWKGNTIVWDKGRYIIGAGSDVRERMIFISD